MYGCIPQTMEEEVLMEDSPGFKASVGHVGAKASILTLFVLPLLFMLRSEYVITDERVYIENKALSSDTSEVRIDDIQQVSTYSKFLGASGIEVTVASGTGIQIPVSDAAANHIRQVQRE